LNKVVVWEAASSWVPSAEDATALQSFEGAELAFQVAPPSEEVKI
jgi:hypothetical protein